jgi:hypothetical protein
VDAAVPMTTTRMLHPAAADSVAVATDRAAMYLDLNYSSTIVSISVSPAIHVHHHAATPHVWQ